MIRRDAGVDFLLITQMDHAAVAAELASHFGNERFARPTPREPLLRAVALHDAGWPLHDDDPVLNDRGRPLDVFEVPKLMALKIWAASAARAAIADPYAGLLTSLHSLALSIHTTAPAPPRNQKFDVQKMHEQFDVNKFQHREVERQEQLRRVLKFRTDMPLKHGVAEPNLSADEDRLRFDFRLLQAMDLLSLCLCRSSVPANETNDVLPSPKSSALKLRMTLTVTGILHVTPWPFDIARIELNVPAKRVSNQKFDSLEAFRSAYRDAATEIVKLAIKDHAQLTRR